MVKFQVGDRKRMYTAHIPQNWDEVPENIYPNLAQLYLKTSDRMNQYDKLVRVFCLLTLEAWNGVKQLSDDQLAGQLHYVRWVFETLDLTVNKIPSFTHGKTTYVGPESELANLRFGEYCMAEAYFIHYWQTRDERSLDKLIAVLYRPKGEGEQYIPGHVNYRGDVREKFNGNNVDVRSGLLEDLDLAIKDGIYLFYATARDILAKGFPHVFPKKRAKNKTLGNQQVPDYGWLGVFDDLLGEKGRTADSLEDEFLATTLMSLERAQIKWRDMKRKK